MVNLPSDIVAYSSHFTTSNESCATQGIDPQLIPVQPKSTVYYSSSVHSLSLPTEFEPSQAEIVKKTFRHLTEIGSRVWYLEARQYLWTFISIKYPRGLLSVLTTLERHKNPSLALHIPPATLHISHLSFAEFRSHGLGRSIGQGNTERFVTPLTLFKLLRATRGGKKLEKPEAVWDLQQGLEEEADDWDQQEEDDEEEAKEFVVRPGNLSGVAFSEYMDSSITFPILCELLFRGGYVAEYSRISSPHPSPPTSPSTGTPPTTPSPPASDLSEFRGRSRTRHPSSALANPPPPPRSRSNMPRSLSGGSSIFHSPDRRRMSLETWSKSRSRSRFEGPYRSSIAISKNIGRENENVVLDDDLENVMLVQTVEGSTEVRPLDALDLTGCVSERFVEGLRVFVERFNLRRNVVELLSNNNLNHGSKGKSTVMIMDEKPDQDFKLDRIQFPHLTRLGLFNCLLPPDLLIPFVASFPELTHLDLANTRANSQLLKCLARAGEGKGKMRFEVLSLSRCRNLDSSSIKGLLVGDSEVSSPNEPESSEWGQGLTCSRIVDFSLFGDVQIPSPLIREDLISIITKSPMFSSGLLRRLDLSSSPMSDLILSMLPPLPNLLELGLAHCREITLRAVSNYLIENAPCVEVLNLCASCPINLPNIGQNSARRRLGNDRGMDILALFTQLIKDAATPHSRPLLDFLNPKPPSNDDLEGRKTHLRVVELDKSTLTSIRGGPPTWKVIWGKGRRGWLVDISVAGVEVEGGGRKLIPLPESDERRVALLALSALNGNVPSNTGWFAQKPELLHGLGFLGAENGLYAFHKWQV